MLAPFNAFDSFVASEAARKSLWNHIEALLHRRNGALDGDVELLHILHIPDTPVELTLTMLKTNDFVRAHVSVSASCGYVLVLHTVITNVLSKKPKFIVRRMFFYMLISCL